MHFEYLNFTWSFTNILLQFKFLFVIHLSSAKLTRIMAGGVFLSFWEFYEISILLLVKKK